MHITIPYTPRKWATEFHDSGKRFSVLVMHRRAGKTVAAVNHLIRASLLNPDTKYAYIAPTYKQVKNIAWDNLKEYARVIPGVKFNESELRCDFPNGSRITLFGADNPDSLRGITLWGVIFDEYSQQPSNIWTEIISPTLSSTQGWAIWIGTPKGKNAFYRLYEDNINDPDWYTALLRASESGVLPESELAIQRKNMSEDEYLQEYECSWEASIKGAYYAREIQKAREENRIAVVPHEPMVPVHTWWDLGVGDETTIIFIQNTGWQWRVIDCYTATGEGFQHYAQILKDKGYYYGKHFAPHDIAVRMLGETAMTRLEIARKLGIVFETKVVGDKETTVVPMLSVDDGINALRMRFKSLWFDAEKCALLLDALTHYRKKWNDSMGRFDEKPHHDWSSHFADAMRYWAVTPLDEIQNDFDDSLVQQVSQNRMRDRSFR
jgi:phage terminase large subunit